MTPDHFPLMRSTQKDPQWFDAAVLALADGLASGAIRNAVLVDAKHTLSRAANKAWDQCVGDRYFSRGLIDGQPDAVLQLYYDISIMGLHNVKAALKRVEGSKASGEPVAAMVGVLSEAMPLVNALGVLKDMVVKGRVPAQAPASPHSPDKLVMTCPVCFRAVAVQRGTMAHHGYKRPGRGWQTGSCQGVRFKPLEVSNEGLVWLEKTLLEQYAVAKNAHAARATSPVTMLVELERGAKLQEIGRDHAHWARTFERWVAELESEIWSLERDLPLVRTTLAAWRPVPNAYAQAPGARK